ncbi:MAG: MBL fold metallo-hydrolase [Candidatus Micrarchaeia archaeon]
MEILKNVFLVEGEGFCSNVYVLINEGEALLIDSGDGSNSDEILSVVGERNIKVVLLTHGHWDHVGGMRYINAGGLISRKDAERMDELNSVFPYKKEIKNIEEFKKEVIKFGSFELQVIPTPGHTPGSVCFFERRNRILFSGDTLFAYGYVGRTDLPGGDERQLAESLEKIKKLNYKLLCPGHEGVERL